MTDIYRVTAPYITLKSKAETGAGVVLGYYRDALVPASVDPEDLARHVRKGMVEKVGAAEAKAVDKQQAEADQAAAEAAKEGRTAPKAPDSPRGSKTA